MGLKDNIIAAGKKSVKANLTPVKAFGEDAFIKEMSGKERDAFEAFTYMNGKPNYDRFRARLLARTLCDSEGNLIFAENDVDALADLPSGELVRLFAIASKVNGLTKDDVDELAKNS